MTALIVLIIFFVIWGIIEYKVYEPQIDVIQTGKGVKVLLWYNEHIGGYPTGKRTYQQLLPL